MALACVVGHRRAPSSWCVHPTSITRDIDVESSHRTQLAAERTWLSWWRTALGTAAAGLAVGRLLPEVTSGTTWPYVLLGSGYATLAVALMVAGGMRQRRVRAALREGSFQELDGRWVAAFTIAGALLAAATLAVVVAGY